LRQSQRWFNEQRGSEEQAVYSDYNGRKIVLDRFCVNKHLDDKIDKYKDRHQTIEKIPETLAKPDDVWYNGQQRKTLLIIIVYLRHDSINRHNVDFCCFCMVWFYKGID
jgi:hypothetical protein